MTCYICQNERADFPTIYSEINYEGFLFSVDLNFKPVAEQYDSFPERPLCVKCKIEMLHCFLVKLSNDTQNISDYSKVEDVINGKARNKISPKSC